MIVFKVTWSYLFVRCDLLYMVPTCYIGKSPQKGLNIPSIILLEISVHISYRTTGVFFDTHKHWKYKNSSSWNALCPDSPWLTFTPSSLLRFPLSVSSILHNLTYNYNLKFLPSSCSTFYYHLSPSKILYSLLIYYAYCLFSVLSHENVSSMWPAFFLFL